MAVSWNECSTQLFQHQLSVKTATSSLSTATVAFCNSTQQKYHQAAERALKRKEEERRRVNDKVKERQRESECKIEDRSIEL